MNEKIHSDKKCGLIGNPLGHSYSPQIHAHFADYEYKLMPMEEEEVAPFLARREFDAINVTIPYKKTVMPYLDTIADEALRIGSVNTIVKDAEGKLHGYNTDYFGFSYMLDRKGIEIKGKKVIVFGSGGASVTAQTVAADRGASSIVVIDVDDNRPEVLALHGDAEVLINATPVGMYPKNGMTPVSLTYFPNLTAVVDVIYNPEKTALILDAEERGITSTSGLPMLVAQAKVAAELFTGESLSDEVFEKTLAAVSGAEKNIVLIGMPGAGKSTVGKALAEELGRQFVDIDAEIVKAAGKPIPEIFADDGEKAFRDLETEVLAEFTKQSRLVIATGGGAVIRAENRRLLRQNGTVVHLKRDLSDLPKDGRPLSQKHSAEELWNARKAFYEGAADYEVAVSPDVEVTVSRVKDAIS